MSSNLTVSATHRWQQASSFPRRSEATAPDRSSPPLAHRYEGVDPKIDRLAYADCAHVEDELRARACGGEFPPPLAHPDERAATCRACGCCGDAAGSASSAAPLSAGDLDALHLRFWSADHKRFDHIGFAHAAIAACARAKRQRAA